jgi:hypothetical protein
MDTVDVILGGKVVQMTEQELKKQLIEEALRVARDPKIRFHLSKASHAIQEVGNRVYEGRQRVVRRAYLGDFFAEAYLLQDRLVDLVQAYCMKQAEMRWDAWNAGWEAEVVPKILAMRTHATP